MWSSVSKPNHPPPAAGGEHASQASAGSGLLSDLKAGEVLVLGNESMPFCGRVGGADAGIAVDILQAITAAGGPTFRFQLGLPWKRAQLLVQELSGHPVAIIPLTRTPTREKTYRWITPLIPHAIHLHTYRRDPPLTSVEQAKELQLGVIRGSAILPELDRLGFTGVHEIANAETCARMLAAGRFDVLVESEWVDTYIWRSIGQDPEDLQRGPQVGPSHQIYLAAGIAFPPALADQIQEAMAHVRESGQLDEIYASWH